MKKHRADRNQALLGPLEVLSRALPKRKRGIAFLITLGLLATAVEASLAPRAVPFIVNSETNGMQRQPAVDFDGSGNALVVWDTDGLAIDETEVAARLLGTDGSPVAAEFQVNTTTTDSQFYPAVTGLPTSGFVVSWVTFDLDTLDDAIGVQRLDGAGDKVGGELTIDESEVHYRADIAALANGSFVVVWDDTFDIFGQRFGADDSRIGDVFQVNAEIGTMYGPRVEAGGDGAFTVVWEDRSDIDGDGEGVLMRRFDSAGEPISGDLQVNSTTEGNQYRPSIGMKADGSFVVVWETFGQDTVGDGAFAQVFAADGSKVGGEFRVDDGNSEYASYLAAAGADDGFVVAWAEPRTDGGTDENVRARRLDMVGNAGDVIDIDPQETGSQSAPAVAAAGDRAWVVWETRPGEEDLFVQELDILETTIPPATSTPTPDESPTTTATPSPTGALSSPTPTASMSTPPTETPAPACPGDCNGDGEVNIGELIRAVGIALGNTSVDECPAADTSGNGEVNIGELIQAVNAALSGC